MNDPKEGIVSDNLEECVRLAESLKLREETMKSSLKIYDLDPMGAISSLEKKGTSSG